MHGVFPLEAGTKTEQLHRQTQVCSGWTDSGTSRSTGQIAVITQATMLTVY